MGPFVNLKSSDRSIRRETVETFSVCKHTIQRIGDTLWPGAFFSFRKRETFWRICPSLPDRSPVYMAEKPLKEFLNLGT